MDDEYGMKTPKLRKTNNNKKEEVSLENEKDMDTSGLYVVVDRITAGLSSSTQNTTYQICNIQLVNAPEDGPLRSETCRATKCYD